MLKGIVNCFIKKQTNKKFQSYNDKKKFWQHISVKIKLCAKSGFMITRSYCSSWTRSIILQSMQDLRSNPQGAGNPNIPRSWTALLQSSQSAAPGTSVYHTHASPSLSKRCERFCSLPVGEGGKLLPLPAGSTRHTHPTKNRGSQCRVRKWVDNSSEENQIIPNQMGQVGENNKKNWLI